MQLQLFLLGSKFGIKLLLCSFFLALHIKSVLKRLKTFLTYEMKIIPESGGSLWIPQTQNAAIYHDLSSECPFLRHHIAT